MHGIAWLVTEAEIKVDADPAEIDRLVSTAMSVLLAGLTVVAEEESGDR